MSACMKRSVPKTVIGLTGGVGTGKSTVAGMFRAAGARVIDADRIARALVVPGTTAYRAIVKRFGKGIVAERGAIDRAALGRLVFEDAGLRKELTAILHPAIIRRIKEEVRAVTKGLVVIDAPLLYETGLHKNVDAVVVVKASREAQVRRCNARSGLSREETLSRIAAQLPLKEKVRSADYVIDNNGTLRQTEKQVELLRRNVWKS